MTPSARFDQLRQGAVIARLAAHAAARTDLYAAAILVGSCAAGTADPLSDIDLILLVPDGGFDRAWQARRELHVDDALVVWDEPRPGLPELAGHCWLTRDLVLVETLFATPSSGFRLAEPYVVLAGAPPAETVHRPPVSRAEFTATPHPVDHAYSLLKATVRRLASEQRG